MKTERIIIDITFDEGTYYTPQDIIENINLQYLNEAFNLDGIANLVISEKEEELKKTINFSSVYQAMADFQSELEALI